MFNAVHYCVISYDFPSVQPEAERLSKLLQYPCYENIDNQKLILSYQFNLNVTEKGLALYAHQLGFKYPIQIDFIAASQSMRGKDSESELLVKACGNKRNSTILDVTGGLGRDALLLVLSGHCVMMCERNPLLACLLKDALTRWQALDSETSQRLSFINEDAITLLQQSSEVIPDVIYCDPMHPIRKKAAKVKKEMQILRELIGDDSDQDKLLPLCYERAGQRLVVKQPRHATSISILPKPSYQILGNSIRFDVFVK